MVNALVALHGVLGAFTIGFGAKLGRRAALIGVLAPAATTVALLAWLPGVLDGRPVVEQVAWIPQLGLSLDVRLDAFAALAALLVSGIGVAVFAYAGSYLPADGPGVGRSLGLLSLFAGSMLGLVVSDDLIVLFAFWELTTITSYLLIGNDHEDRRARAAALQALLVTGAGGLAMLGGFVVLGRAAGTYRLSELLAEPPAAGPATTLALVAVLGGAFTKSAAYPFHAWLPAAMVAPTPISAYLHSATMVKAGIVLVARFAPAFHTHHGWQPLVIGVGLVTMVGGGLRALRQVDLKLLLAHGTVSQLGLLLVLFGLGDPGATRAGVAMLVAHALFKAALFMVVGMVEHESGTRDLRALHRLGPGWLPVEVIAVVSALSMAGFGIVFGFVGKELALDALLRLDRGAAWLVVAAVSGASVLTAAYSARFVWGLLGAAWPYVQPARAAHPPSPAFVAPAALLAAATLTFGVAPGLLDDLVGRSASALEGTVAPSRAVHLALWHGFGTAPLLSLAIVAAGALLAWRHQAVEPVLRLGARLPHGDAVFLRCLAELNRVADRVTAVVQSGSLPAYAAVILLTAAVVPLAALLSGGTPFELPVAVARPAHLPLAALVVVAAIAAARVRRRFAAALFLGVVGYAMAGLFMVQGAPDLALTQVVFETLSTVLFMLVLRQMPDGFAHRRPLEGRVARAGVALAVGSLVFVFMVAAGQDRRPSPVSAEMVQRAHPDGHGRNVVNVILVDFRGDDTLGEIAVLCVAAIGAVALARASHHAPGPVTTPDGGRPLIVDLPVRLIFHALLIGSVFALLFAGHDQPGGGFVGGLLAGAAIALRFVAGGMGEVRTISRFKPWTVLGSGLLASTVTALVPVVAGRPLLESFERTIDAGPLGTAKLTSTLAFDLGVYLVVVGLVLMVFEAFGEERHGEVVA